MPFLRRSAITAAAPVMAAAAVASACVAESGGAGTTSPPGDLPGWQRVLVDDFTGPALDTRIWGSYRGQPGGDPGGWWEPTHVVVRDGLLNLLTYRDPLHRRRWVSGGVSSAKALKQRYGKYLVRFRIDAGYGIAGIVLLWPDHGWPPEIDFAETGGEHRGRPHISATLHYGAHDRTLERRIGGDFTNWHVAGVEWTRGELVYTLDGRPWATLRSPYVPSGPMELDVQSQAGTCGRSTAPCPDGGTPGAVTMQVDWVVAYKPVPRWGYPSPRTPGKRPGNP